MTDKTKDSQKDKKQNNSGCTLGLIDISQPAFPSGRTKELEDEIKRIQKMEKRNKSDIEFYNRCYDELKGRNDMRKELLEEVKKIIDKYPFSVYGTNGDFIINQMELLAKDRKELKQQLEKLREKS